MSQEERNKKLKGWKRAVNCAIATLRTVPRRKSDGWQQQLNKYGKNIFFGRKEFFREGYDLPELLECESLGLNKLIPYTTRPIRAGEMNGREYFFTDECGLEKLREIGRVIDERDLSYLSWPLVLFYRG